MMTHKNHHTSGKTYTLSPVATVEYIRTQMRDESPHQLTFAKSAKNSDELVIDTQNCQRDRYQKENTSVEGRQGNMRCSCSTDGYVSNCDHVSCAQYKSKLYSNCRNSRDHDDTKPDNKGPNFQEHKILRNVNRQTRITASSSTCSEAFSVASSAKPPCMKLQFSNSFDSDITLDSYRYSMPRSADRRPDSNQHDYILERNSPYNKNSSATSPEQPEATLSDMSFVKTPGGDAKMVAGQITTLAKEKVLLYPLSGKPQQRIRISVATGSRVSMGSDTSTAGSRSCCPVAAPALSPSSHFKSVNRVKEDLAHTPCSVVKTSLESESLKSHSQIKDRGDSQIQKTEATDDRRAAQTVDESNKSYVVASNGIDSRHFVDLNTDQKCHATKNEPSLAAQVQNDYSSVPRRSCSHRDATHESIQYTQPFELNMSPKIDKEITEIPWLCQVDVSRGCAPQTTPGSGSNHGLKSRRTTLTVVRELPSLVESNKGRGRHHSDMGLDYISCQQSGLNYFNRLPDKKSKEMTRVFNSRSSRCTDSNSPGEITQQPGDASRVNGIVGPVTAGTLKVPTQGLNDSAVMKNKSVVKRSDNSNLFNVNTLRDFKPLKERLKTRRFTDLSSSFSKYKDQLLSHVSKKFKQKLSEDVSNFRTHDSPMLCQRKMPRKGAPNRRYSLGVMCATSAKIASIYSRPESPTPCQGQPSKQPAAKGISNRRYSRGVMGAKSTDITELYSSHDYPSCKVNLQPVETDKQLQRNKKPLGRTFACSHLQIKPGSSHKLANGNRYLSPESPATPYSSCKKMRDSADEISKACSKTDTKIMSKSKDHNASHNQSQLFNFTDEDFRSADVFLAELNRPCHGSGSSSSTFGEVDSGNLHQLSTNNRHDNNDMLITKGRNRYNASNGGSNTLPKYSIASDRTSRQSFPVCSSRKLDTSLMPARRMTLELRCRNQKGRGSKVPVVYDVTDDSVDKFIPAGVPFKDMKNELVSLCKVSGEEDSASTLYSCSDSSKNTLYNATVDERAMMKQNSNGIECSRGLSRNHGLLQESAPESTTCNVQVRAQQVNNSYKKPTCIQQTDRQLISQTASLTLLSVLDETSKRKKSPASEQATNATCLEFPTLNENEITQGTDEGQQACLDLTRPEVMLEISARKQVLYNLQNRVCESELEGKYLPSNRESSKASPLSRDVTIPLPQTKMEAESQKTFDANKNLAYDASFVSAAAVFLDCKSSAVGTKETGPRLSGQFYQCAKELNRDCAKNESRQNGNSPRTNVQRLVVSNIPELHKTHGDSRESSVCEDNHGFAELNTLGSVSDIQSVPGLPLDAAINQHQLDVAPCLGSSVSTQNPTHASSLSYQTARNQETTSLTSTEAASTLHNGKQSSPSAGYDAVHFAAGPLFLTVHIIGTEDRNGGWHHVIRERHNFERRVAALEHRLSPFLETSHRKKVLTSRGDQEQVGNTHNHYSIVTR